jgi:hypothetical protein
LSADLKACVVGMWRMCAGSEFHCLGAQKEKDLSPYVFVRIFGMERMRVSEEERSCREGKYEERRSER